MARPRKPVDPDMVEKLAQAGCSAEQIGAILGVDHHTIERRFAPILKKGRENARGRLQVRLFHEALNGNTAALIFLAKNWLGMTDHPLAVVNVTQNSGVAPIRLSKEQQADLERLYTGIQKRSLQRAVQELASEESEDNNSSSLG